MTTKHEEEFMDQQEKEIVELQKEVEFWRNATMRLADYHAANAASMGTVKATPKYQKERLLSIVEDCARVLRGLAIGTPRHGKVKVDAYNDHVLARCEDAAAKMRVQDSSKNRKGGEK